MQIQCDKLQCIAAYLQLAHFSFTFSIVILNDADGWSVFSIKFAGIDS